MDWVDRGKDSIDNLDIPTVIESIRLFQSVESRVLEEIARGTILREVKKGQVLFGKDPTTGEYFNDLNLLVVVKGQVEVFTEVSQRMGGVKKEMVRELVCTVDEGKTVSSILSILESLIDPDGAKIPDNPATPHQRKLRVQRTWNKNFGSGKGKESDSGEGFLVDDEETKTNYEEEEEELISAIASTDAILAEVPLQIFQNIQKQYPKAITKLTSSIIMRLQRVTLQTMNKYFGLTQQLINPAVIKAAARKLQKYVPPKPDFKSKESQLREDFDCAFRGFSKLLGLDEAGDEILRNSLQIERHSPGSIVMVPKDPFVRIAEDSKHNDACDPCLYYIIRGGFLDVYLHDDTHLSTKDDNEVELVNSEDHLLYKGMPGDMIGHLAAITGDFYYRVVASSFISPGTPVRTTEMGQPIVVGKLTKQAFDKLVLNDYLVMNRMVHMIFIQLAPVVKLIDYAVDWEHLQAGEIVCQQGLSAPGMYVVLSGRLRAVHEASITEQTRLAKLREKELFSNSDESIQGTVISEYGRGDSFGAVEVLTESPFTASVVAVRDTELALISNRLFKIFMRKFPEVVMRFSKIIGESWKKQQLSLSQKSEGRSSISTIAVLGITEDTSTKTFCARLAAELKNINSTIHLDKNLTVQHLGKNSFDKRQEEILIRWLGEMEEMYKVVVYECDTTLSPWTRRCLRQADCILLVANSNTSYEISEFEKYLLQNANISARRELVLLHSDNLYPNNTMNWLSLRRGWCRACHHVMDFKELKRDRPEKAWRIPRSRNTSGLGILRPIPMLIQRGASSIWRTIKMTGNVSQTPIFGHANPKDDIARIARLLTGTAIGLVLGGGGARGCSHVGVIQALEENGIPIDMVGGTSMGALIGSLYARDPDYIHVLTKAKVIAKKMSNRWTQALDLTYPRVAFFTGAGLNEVVQQSLGETQVEDLVLNYFAISTNITNSKMGVHREGMLWKYVRASMSLVGFVPPLCDVDGSYLVDGGYINNLPADVMSGLGINTIIAVDVGGEVDTNYANYGDSLSGWWLLWNKWNPFVPRENIPNLSDIQAQLAYVSSEAVLENVKRQKRCLYLRPPITQYGTLDFAKFEEIAEVGYNYAQKEITKWKKQREEYSLPSFDAGEEKSVPVLRRRSSANANLQSSRI